MVSIFFKLIKPTNGIKEANAMDNMILKRLVASILALSLATNGNISLASSPGEDIPAPNKGEERDEEKKEGTAEVKEEKEAKEEERKEDEKPQEEKKEDNEEIKRDEKKVDIGGEETEEEKDEEKDISGQMEDVEKYKEEMKEKLYATLLDPKKQEWIEVKVIKRLKSLDTTGVFSNVFNDVLLKCEETRRKPSYHGKNIPSSEANEGNDQFLSILTKNCAQISWVCRNELYSSDPQVRQISLFMIRALSDMENEFGTQYKTFFRRLNQIFYHSRRLLTATIAPQIIEKYGATGVNEDEIKYSTVQSTTKTSDEEDSPSSSLISQMPTSTTVQVCEFQKDDVNYACLFHEKQAGVHFGALIEIGVTNAKDEEGLPIIEDANKRVYYLKAYHGYPAVKEKQSSHAYTDSTTMVTTTQSDPRGLRVQELNIKEPFIYKLLENLQVGPVVYFMINPYINNGFYIITEDLNTDSVSFVELDQLKEIFGDILRAQTLDAGQLKMMTDLAEMNLLTNILELGDIKPDNIGYIFTQSSDGSPSDPSKAQIQIVDFLDESDAGTDAVNNFMSGDMFISPEAGGVFSQCLQGVEPIYSRIRDILQSRSQSQLSLRTRGRFRSKAVTLHRRQESQDEIKQLCDQLPAAVDKQIQQAAVALRQLVRRGVEGDLVKVIEKTEKDFKTFFDSPSSIGKRNLEITYPLTHDEQYGKLRGYCEYICTRFENLNKFIAGGYKQWLEDLLKQVQVVQDAQSKKTPEEKE